jgi:pentatricopeptide repeat protein
VPHKALEIFEQMKREGVRPTVVTYSALISAAEKGQQWKLALEVLEEMKAAGHGANVIGRFYHSQSSGVYISKLTQISNHFPYLSMNSLLCGHFGTFKRPNVAQSPGALS